MSLLRFLKVYYHPNVKRLAWLTLEKRLLRCDLSESIVNRAFSFYLNAEMSWIQWFLFELRTYSSKQANAFWLFETNLIDFIAL
jgi:hypothetical protein